jgi:pilus assembly protein Flp/PilA
MYGQCAMVLGPMQSDFFMSKMLRIQAHIDCQELNANFDGIPSMVATHQMDYAGSSYRIFIGIYLKNQRLEKKQKKPCSCWQRYCLADTASTNRRSILCRKGVALMEKLVRFLKEEDGVTAIEYGLIAALIAIAIIAALIAVGGGLNTIFNRVVTALTTGA